MQSTAQGFDELLKLSSDLASVLAVPQIRSEADVPDVLAQAASLLVQSLCLEFAYLRCGPHAGNPEFELISLPLGADDTEARDQIRQTLLRWITFDGPQASFRVYNPTGEGDVNIATSYLGGRREIGVLVAGSVRPDFPNQLETLLLQITASHLAPGLCEMRGLNERQRAASELEQCIAGRTRDLTHANEKLRREISERWAAEKKLVETHETTRTILDMIADRIIALDAEGRYTYLNKPAAQHYAALGKDSAKLIGQVFCEVAPNDPVAEDWRGVMNDRTVRAHELYDPACGEWLDTRIYPSSNGGIAVFQTDITRRKRAEESLRRSDAHLHEGQRITETGSCVWNVRTGELTCSPEYLRIFGLDPDAKQTYDTFVTSLHADDRARVCKLVERAALDKVDFETEYTIVRPDGALRPVRALGRPVQNARGELTEYIGTVVDLTARRSAEQEQRKLASVVENSPDFIGIATPEGRVLYVNTAGKKIVGLDRLERGNDATMMFDYAFPEDEARIRNDILPAVHEHGHWAGEVRFRHFVSGAAILMLCHVFLVKDEESDRSIALATISRDITERTRIEEKLGASEETLRRSERRFRLLVESIPHHVWSSRPDGSLGYWNKQLADYTGLSHDELKCGGWEAVHPGDIETVRAAWRRAFGNCAPYQMEKRIRGKDGGYRRFLCCGVPVQDGDDQPLEWFGTNTDVEDRRQAEETLRKAQLELLHIARATTVGELSTSIAHEVNQPLSAVVMNAHACLRWLGANEPDMHEARAAAHRIVRDANRASAVISRIRAFLKRGTVRSEPLQIKDVIDEVANMIAGDARAGGVMIRIDATGQIPPVNGDRVQLQQVVLNIAVNALEAMRSVPDACRELSIAVERYGFDAIVVCVSDTGPGLDAKARGHIFEAFNTTKVEGMGMGLAISRSIIESHGGRIWATPNAHCGERFLFTLPVDRLNTS